MGKTIALKLSEKEEQIVTQLNKKGMSNSELLRNALNQYFAHIHELSSPEYQDNTKNLKHENTESNSSESIKSLKQEIQELHKQLLITQKQFEKDIMKIQRQLYLLYITNSLPKQIEDPIKLDIDYKIHEQVDEFLKKRMLIKGY